jgi:hypothetical protein
MERSFHINHLDLNEFSFSATSRASSTCSASSAPQVRPQGPLQRRQADREVPAKGQHDEMA